MGIRRKLRAVSVLTLAGGLAMSPAPLAAADEIRDAQWALETLRAPELWEETRGAGQIVAVIDNGINANHPDLKGNVLGGKDFIDGGEPAHEDGETHGTSIASIIAAHGHGPGSGDGVVGLAPEAKILPIRDKGFRDDGYAASIRYAVDEGASVINISQKQDRSLAPQEESEAIAYALRNGVVVVAGTGNDGGNVGYPAAYAGVVAVSGTDKTGSFWKGSNRGEHTLLSAPATEVVTASGPNDPNAYGIGDGTSNSTAYVSAAAALLQAEFPDLTAGQIVNRLTETAELPASVEGTQVPHPQYGYGVIRPLAALTEDIPKGSEYGPLRIPEATKEAQEQKERLAESAEMQKQADRKAIIAWSVIGVVGLLVIALVVWLVVRRRKRNRPGRPGGPGGFPGPPGPGHPYPQQGYQQQPYGQQPPPQHTSYGTPPPQGHPAPPPQPPPR